MTQAAGRLHTNTRTYTEKILHTHKAKQGHLISSRMQHFELMSWTTYINLKACCINRLMKQAAMQWVRPLPMLHTACCTLLNFFCLYEWLYDVTFCCWQPLDVELHDAQSRAHGLKAQVGIIGGVLPGFVTGIHKDSVRRWNLWFPSAGVFAEILAGRATGTRITFPPPQQWPQSRRHVIRIWHGLHAAHTGNNVQSHPRLLVPQQDKIYMDFKKSSLNREINSTALKSYFAYSLWCNLSKFHPATAATACWRETFLGPMSSMMPNQQSLTEDDCTDPHWTNTISVTAIPPAFYFTRTWPYDLEILCTLSCSVLHWIKQTSRWVWSWYSSASKTHRASSNQKF